jgi:hypothetical protein
MRDLRAATVLLAIFAVAGPAATQAAALPDVTFSWDHGRTTLAGFGHTPPPEVERFDTLAIGVATAFVADAARQLGERAGPTPLEREFEAFTRLAAALRDYTDALAAAAGRSPGADLSLDPAVVAARRPLVEALRAFIATVKPPDRALYETVNEAFGKGGGYAPVARALAQGIETLTARLQAEAAGQGALGMTATIVPLEAGARPLHLPGYDNNAESSVAAVPNYVPLVDERTRAEVQAAQTLADAAKQLGQVSEQVKRSAEQLQQALDDLRTRLRTEVLEKELASLEQEIGKATAAAGLGDLLEEVQAARALVQTLNAVNPQLTGATDADRLLNLAVSLTGTAEALVEAARVLPAALPRLAQDLQAAVERGAITVEARAITEIKSAATAFADEQVFFRTLADNLAKVAAQFSANDDAALGAARLASTARAIAGPADLSTSLDLARIAGDVHVQDRIVIRAALYRRDPSGRLDTDRPVDDAQQSFVVQRYGLFPDAVRGALIFADPRGRIDRAISYQAAPALGFYWRLGLRNHRVWNAASPSFGFTMALLDFSDAQSIEVGIAAGVSLARDLLWVGYGRNLQARANYFYLGVNPLLLGRMVANRSGL